MANQLSSYVQEVSSALQRKDGQRLSALLSAGQGRAFEIAHTLASSGRPVPEGPLLPLAPPWRGMVAALLGSLVAQHRGERGTACRLYRDGYAAELASLLNAEKGPETEHLIPAALAAARALAVLGAAADEEAGRAGGAANQLSQCAIKLQDFFRGLVGSRTCQAKKDASVAIVCVMMKVYFRLNTINNCKQPLKQIVSHSIFDNAKIAYKVTLRYYTGRLAAYDEDFALADEHLSYAFENCAPGAVGNERRVLRYLIPVKMLLGVLPSEALLRRSGLTEYEPVRRAVAGGDLALLLRTLETNQVRFIQAGTYLLLERLQMTVLRTLLRKCAAVHAQINPAKAHQLPLAALEAALKLQGIEKDPLELQCLLANLIFRKYVKGYLAFKSRVLVLAKTDAFPPLSAAQLADPLSAPQG